MTSPITALMVGEQSRHKPLNPFGSALIRKPVLEGRAMADEMDQASQERIGRKG